MIITYNIGSLAAELKVMLLSSISGLAIRQGLCWQLHAVSKPDKVVAEKSEPIPLFSITEGEYTILAVYQDSLLMLGSVKLAKNTRTDMVFMLVDGLIQSSEDYFCEYDAKEWFACRQQERELQSTHGFATLPLRDPSTHMQGDYGSQLQAHPLLRDAVQFDGVPPSIRPDPSENKEALQLTLAQRLMQTPNATPTPAPTR